MASPSEFDFIEDDEDAFLDEAAASMPPPPLRAPPMPVGSSIVASMVAASSSAAVSSSYVVAPPLKEKGKRSTARRAQPQVVETLSSARGGDDDDHDEEDEGQQQHQPQGGNEEFEFAEHEDDDGDEVVEYDEDESENENENEQGDINEDEEEEDAASHASDALSSSSSIGSSSSAESSDSASSESEEEEEDEGKAPVETQKPVQRAPWACRYCGISSTGSVARCIESGMWFCNGNGDSTASHIIQHLVRSRNKEICLHHASPLGETVIECYNCAARNVFMMGFLPKGDGVVVLLCRACLGIGALKELGWDLDSWTPLIRDRAFVPWLLQVPSHEEHARARRISTAQIDKLEALWKTNPKAELEELEKPGVEGGEPATVLLQYEDGFHFQNVFGPLVQIESEYDRDMKEKLTEENVSIHWNRPKPGARWMTAEVFFTPGASESLRLTMGDELLLKLSKRLLPASWGAKHDWEAKATVVALDDQGACTTVELRTSSRPPLDTGEGYTVSFVWKPVTYERMQLAMKKFAMDQSAVSTYLYHKILGHDTVNDDATAAAFGLTFSVAGLGGGPAAAAASAPLPSSAPGLPKLNDSQYAAVQKVLTRPLALIQGPPGTGKTVTLATLVYHMVKTQQYQQQQQLLPPQSQKAPGPILASNSNGKKKKTHTIDSNNHHREKGKTKGHPASSSRAGAANASSLPSSFPGATSSSAGPVLVCAPSNVAVDHLTERISQTGVRVVRVAAKSREHIASSVEHLSLHNMIQALEEAGAHGGKGSSKKANSDEGGGGGGGEHSKRRKRLIKEILQAADVVCCTCAGAGDPRLEGIRFRRVLIDEATQATEPESLIPLVMGCEQFILVGDHCQLGPVVMSKRAANAGLNSSIFERLVTLGLRPVRLQIQYRMHPSLSEWPSNTFYEGSLQNGVTAADRTSAGVDFPWIDPARPMMFYMCNGSEEMAATGTSFLNRAEAVTCEKIVTALLRGGVLPEQVGVITPYEGQRAYIVQQLKTLGPLRAQLYADVEVSSVDAFQGREKEYVIMSCVRANEKQGIGFLNDPRRLNVALTRAKRGLIVLGNARVLAQKPLWNDLLVHFRERNLLVEGGLSNLQVSLMKFPKIGKYFRDHRQRMLENASLTVFSGDVNDPFGERAMAVAATNGGGSGGGGGVPPYGTRYPHHHPASMYAPASGVRPGLGEFDYQVSPEFGTQLTQPARTDGVMIGSSQHTQNSQRGPGPFHLHGFVGGPATQQTQQSQRSQLSQSGGF